MSCERETGAHISYLHAVLPLQCSRASGGQVWHPERTLQPRRAAREVMRAHALLEWRAEEVPARVQDDLHEKAPPCVHRFRGDGRQRRQQKRG